MRLVTYGHAAGDALGVARDGSVANLRDLVAWHIRNRYEPQPEALAAVLVPDTMVDFIQAGPRAWATASEAVAAWSASPAAGVVAVPLSDVTLKAPLRPTTLIMGGANFADHLKETNRAKPDSVEFFLKSPHAVVGPGEPIEPGVTNKVDYEVELGIVIGRPARYVPREDALDYIFGYTILNDISARDQQIVPYDSKDGQHRFQLRFGEGKSYDTGCPIGPWIVTGDELADVGNLQLKTTVNGELRQSNNTRNLIWDVPDLVSFYSQFMTLQPGFILASGTPGGPALGSDLDLGGAPYARDDGVNRGWYLQAGDIVCCEIEGIGILTNPVA